MKTDGGVSVLNLKLDGNKGTISIKIKGERIDFQRTGGLVNMVEPINKSFLSYLDRVKAARVAAGNLLGL